LLLAKKQEKSSDEFWKEYEEKTGEKVLTRGLGRYVSGWDEFDKKNWGGLWGLIITTSGGFRFHHFPQNSWIDAFTNFYKTETPKEKTIFIPQEKTVSLEIAKEKRWWKKFFSSAPPQVIIKYIDEEGIEKQMVLEAEYGY